jgi:hypothetical protein
VFTGDIAEILFDRSGHVLGHLLTHGRWKALFNLLRTLRSRGVSWQALGHSLLGTFVPGGFANWYLHARGRDFPQRIPDWLDSRKVNEVVYRRDVMPRGRDRWKNLQLGVFLEGAAHTLEADDICGLLAGVTVRRPFADVDMIEFFLSLPAEIKFPDTRSKTLMRRILRNKLPDEILDRRDKTVFNDYVMEKIDYSVPKRFLTNPTVRIPGVDYEKLAVRIERRDFKMTDYVWTNDLVRVHAFLSLW